MYLPVLSNQEVGRYHSRSTAEEQSVEATVKNSVQVTKRNDYAELDKRLTAVEAQLNSLLQATQSERNQV